MASTFTPTLAGFQAFIANVMQVPPTALPSSSPVIAMALAVAMELVNHQILRASPLMYQLAVYNLAGSNLINYAEDVPDAPPVPNSDPQLPYFAHLRQEWNINGFVAGVVQFASDVSTSQQLVVQEAAKMFTLSDLQNLKDPYGRRYLDIAQKVGTDWGLS